MRATLVKILEKIAARSYIWAIKLSGQNIDDFIQQGQNEEQAEEQDTNQPIPDYGTAFIGFRLDDKTKNVDVILNLNANSNADVLSIGEFLYYVVSGHLKGITLKVLKKYTSNHSDKELLQNLPTIIEAFEEEAKNISEEPVIKPLEVFSTKGVLGVGEHNG